MKVLQVSVWIILFVILISATPALEESLGNPSTAVSDSSGSAVERDDASLLAVALQLRETKPALFGGALGVLIVSVLPGSQAAEKGLRLGDIVIAYAGEPMNSAEQFVEAVQTRSSEVWVVVRFIRGEKLEDVKVRGGRFGTELRDISELEHLLVEVEQAYNRSNYSLVFEKSQTGLDQARQLKNQPYVGKFLVNFGAVYNNLAQYTKAIDYHQQALAVFREIDDKRQIGNTLNNLGSIYGSLGQYTKALDHAQQALVIVREIADKRQEGNVLYNLSGIYANFGQYTKALDYSQQALAIAREAGNKHQEGYILSDLTGIYGGLSQYTKALDHAQQALDIIRKIGDKRQEGRILNNFGGLYMSLYQRSKALDYFQQALAIFREIGDKRGEGDTMGNIGNMRESWAQHQQALEYYQQALTISHTINAKKLKGNTLGGIGNVYESWGQHSKAMDFYQQTLTIFKETGDKSGESDVISRIGNLYGRLGQYAKTLEYSQQALAIYREIGNKQGEGNTLGNISAIYGSLKQYKKALEYARQATEIFKEIGEKRSESMSIVLATTSKYLDRSEQYKSPFDYLLEFAPILDLEEHVEMGDKYGKANIQMMIGDLFFRMKRYDEALDKYQKSLVIYREIGNKSEEGSNLARIGGVYVGLGLYESAKTAFQDSLKILEILGDPNDLWIAQRGLATIVAYFNQPESAINHYDEAINTLETLRTSLTSSLESSGIAISEIKTKFMEDKFFVYDEFITFLQTEHSKHSDKGYDRKAFEVFEKKQSRVFLEQMGKSTAWRFTGVPKEITTQDRNLENQVAAARKNLSEAYAKSKDIDPSPLRQHLEEVEKAQQLFEEKLKTEYPAYYTLKYPKPVELDKLQQNVLQDDEIILIYNVREEATDLWLVGKQHFQMFSLPLTETQVTEQVAEFRKWGIDRADTTGSSRDLTDSLERDFVDFTKASRALYQQLFPQAVRDLLGQAKPKLLYVVPTSALYELPFEALITDNADKPHYLLQDYAVSYLSSASLLKTLRDAQSKGSQTQRNKRQPLLAFADPVYPPCSNTTTTKGTENVESFAELQTKGYLKAVSSTDCFPPLPSSGQEARAIAKLLEVDEESQPAPLQLKEAAAKSTVFQFNDKQQLDDYQYVLFSTHAILPNEVSFIQQPAIVLSHRQPTDENGFLTMGDVFGLSLNTDLVMLSACNTGLGEKTKGEGTIGLTRAFMYAGTPAVSITLWSVESGATKKLNVGWFNRLKERQALSDSLRAAKLDMLASDSYYRYPYAWAGIVVFGDGKSPP